MVTSPNWLSLRQMFAVPPPLHLSVGLKVSPEHRGGNDRAFERLGLAFVGADDDWQSSLLNRSLRALPVRL
jgi:hypothetical protein